jgi:hypothetical protein
MDASFAEKCGDSFPEKIEFAHPDAILIPAKILPRGSKGKQKF